MEIRAFQFPLYLLGEHNMIPHRDVNSKLLAKILSENVGAKRMKAWVASSPVPVH